MSDPQATFTMDVGILQCGDVRSKLEATKFKYGDFEFFEGDGWISHEFIIKGDAVTVAQIAQYFQDEEDE